MNTKMNPLEFTGKDEKIYRVKERTLSQIFGFLETYIDRPFMKYEYIPNSQKISEMNGNIYAKFHLKGTKDTVTLCVADYYDYINEVNFDN